MTGLALRQLWSRRAGAVGVVVTLWMTVSVLTMFASLIGADIVATAKPRSDTTSLAAIGGIFAEVSVVIAVAGDLGFSPVSIIEIPRVIVWVGCG